MKFKCTTTWGKVEDGGIWDMKETPKTYIFTPADRIARFEKILKCRKDNQSMNPITDWGDGTFTIYPMRVGTPYYFEPI